MQSKIVVILLLSIGSRFVDADYYRGLSEEDCAKYPNEEFSIDFGRCQNTCKFYGRSYDCPDYYMPRGNCYCKAGFARRIENGECVSVTEDVICAFELSIQPEQCSGPNEVYQEFIGGQFDEETCLTLGKSQTNYMPIIRWAPHCACSTDYGRLSNGTCVRKDDERCISESRPSPERCAAFGQIYKENAPCQEACYNETYCPPATGACVCPPNRIPHAFTYYNFENTVELIACYSGQSSCPMMAP